MWGPRTDFCYRQTLILSMCGALLDKKKGLSFAAAILSSIYHLYFQFYFSVFYTISFPKSGSLRIHTIYSFTCSSIINACTIQGFCQSRLGTADQVKSLIKK
jgi:hypothetical protein